MESVREYSMELGGKPLTLQFGKVAKQANGSVLVKYGNTIVLVTATASKEPREGVDFFPLTVDVEERLYAVGRIPGSWGRREGRPPEKAVLQARLTDRPIRPLFPKGFRNEVQIVIMPLAIDHDYSVEIAGMIGASAALCVSDIPFGGPIGAVEMGLVDGEFVINPGIYDSERSDLKLTVAGTKDAISMVEAGANRVSEEVMVDAMMEGHEVIKKIVAFQEQIADEIGKPKVKPELFVPGEEIVCKVQGFVTDRLKEAIRIKDKLERESAIDSVMKETLNMMAEEFPDRESEIQEAFNDILKILVRDMILEEEVRPDGRRPSEIRPISCEVSIIPRVHGSGLFTRGQTQVLSIATLGATSDIQELDTTGLEEFKRYIHHYNFPPFSVGETRPLRGPGRREIGHGALAERALVPVLPDEQDFPYTIRVVSEVLESNGSSSMASVCGSTLSLMDAGVPIKDPVAGVAMGLVKKDDKAVILTDIQGMEDALGDMDFKVAGTEDGITALQMDIKISGVDRGILSTALEKAKAARLFILEKMRETIDKPRDSLSPFAPRIIVVQIDPDKIREVIGPGGKTINKITGETGVKIDIEQDGRVFISAVDEESGQRAKQIIEQITRDVEVGDTYLGKVTRVSSFGAFIEVLPGKEGLMRQNDVGEGGMPEVGDEVMVRVTEVDHLGRINLSGKLDDSGRGTYKGRSGKGRNNQNRSKDRPRNNGKPR